MVTVFSSPDHSKEKVDLDKEVSVNAINAPLEVPYFQAHFRTSYIIEVANTKNKGASLRSFSNLGR